MKKAKNRVTTGKGKRYCCVPDMVLSMGDGSDYDKKFALEFLSQIYDKKHKRGKISITKEAKCT